MGHPMAGYLQKAGYDMRVFNRTAAKADKWVAEYAGTACASPAEAADGADLVFACVGADDDVRAVTTGPEGAFQAMKSGAIFIDNTTASADVARECHAVATAKGLHFIDAPVSGGQAGAENGALTVMCGGDEAPFETARPAISHFAKSVVRLGPSGSGQLCKMVNQLCIAGLVQGLAEGLHFGMKAGLDCRKVIEVISKGAAQSWQMENRYETMIDGHYEHGFAVDWMRKDLNICLGEARRMGAHLPVAALVDQFYSEIQAQGGSRWDTSSLLARLEAVGKKG